RQPLADAIQALGADVDEVVHFQVDCRNDGRVGNLFGDEPLRLADGVPPGGVAANARVADDAPNLTEVKRQLGLAEILAHRGNEIPEDLRVDLGRLQAGLGFALVPEHALDLAAGLVELV